MFKFYFLLWARWAFFVTLYSSASAVILAFFFTLGSYLYQGAPQIDVQIKEALWSVFFFWLGVAWSVSILGTLFFRLKTIFNTCIGGYRLRLLSCQSGEPLKVIGDRDIVKVWRKWFMLLLWLVAALSLFLALFFFVFYDKEGAFGWFNIYMLYGLILLAGYLSFMLLGSRCKKVRTQRC